MEFKERKKLITFLDKAENKFPVNTWEMRGVSIWPLIKISIFFSLYGQTYKKNNSITLKRVVISVIKFLKLNVIYSIFRKEKIKIPKTDILFSGYNAYRTKWKGAFFNKFFDPLMDELEPNKTSTIYEYEKLLDTEKYYKSNRIVDPTQLIHFFRYKTSKCAVEQENMNGLNEFLKLLNEELNYDANKIVIAINKHLHEVFSWKRLWDYVLNKAKPQIIVVLCYYDAKMSGLILAARKKRILSIDMQHGGQGSFNPAYSYSNIPAVGYSVLPDYFWCWDNSSAENINRITKNTRHQSVLVGNPWITYLKKQDIKIDQNIILYTMQTSLKPVLHNYIIEAIKTTTKKYVWWLRLHPRMLKSEIKELEQTLKEHGIYNRVELKDANTLPLPLILCNTTIHVSHFSGCILEANLLKVPINIVMGEVGKKFYKDIIEKREVFYFNPEAHNSLTSFIESKLNVRSNQVDNEELSINYLKTLNKILNSKL